MLDEVGAGRRPVAGDDVDRAGREADLGRELGEPQRGQRRLRVGLEDDRAAGRERGRELPRRHQQRVVPGDDLARDADRLLQRVEEERAADRVRAAGDRRDRGGEEAEVLDGADELRLHRRDRLADVARLELGELLAVRDDRVGERVQEPRALVRRASCPSRRRARRAPPRPRGRRRPRPRAAALPSGSPVAGSTSSRRRRSRLDGLAVDEEAVLPLGRDRHRAGRSNAPPRPPGRVQSRPCRQRRGVRRRLLRWSHVGETHLRRRRRRLAAESSQLGDRRSAGFGRRPLLGDETAALGHVLMCPANRRCPARASAIAREACRASAEQARVLGRTGLAVNVAHRFGVRVDQVPPSARS